MSGKLAQYAIVLYALGNELYCHAHDPTYIPRARVRGLTPKLCDGHHGHINEQFSILLAHTDKAT